VAAEERLWHSANYLREKRHHATSAQYFAREMNWGNAAIGKINSVLHGRRQTSKPDAARSPIPRSAKTVRWRNSRSFSRIFRSPMNSSG
jgi:hypothetical protein